MRDGQLGAATGKDAVHGNLELAATEGILRDALTDEEN